MLRESVFGHGVKRRLAARAVTFPNPISRNKIAKDALARLAKDDDRYEEVTLDLQKRRQPKFGAIYNHVMNSIRRPKSINYKLSEMRKLREMDDKVSLEVTEDVHDSEDGESEMTEQQIDTKPKTETNLANPWPAT